MTSASERQAFALQHPLSDAGDHAAIARLRHVRRHATGLLMMTILAVDR